ncbi:MAG TPA: metallopeptidase TldD-related protein [Thermoanaerobaculia bacterium]|nr:metallopeptidase TldD-related protein [Thermoanaerobaculia bacterium]
MTPAAPLPGVATGLPALVLRELKVRAGHDEVEVFLKRGRSRRLTLGLTGPVSLVSQERAWAVRAGGHRGSFWVAGTGEPQPEGPWPVPTGPAFTLPDPSPAASWNPPSDLDSPLIGETEGLKLLMSIGRELAVELPGARLLHAALEDGSSEAELLSSRGVSARYRHRVAALHLEASGPGRPAACTRLYLAAREGRRFHPGALARRLADRLIVAGSGQPPAILEGGSGEILLAPPVAARLLAGLLPLLVGPRGTPRITALRDRRGRIGHRCLTLIDNGRLSGGIFEAPVDGEGMPCREVLLIEEGTFRQPLLAWWQVGETGMTPTGCSRRPGWRDLPTPGPTHLYVKPDPRISVASLLQAVKRGYYLIDAPGAMHLDLDADLFSLSVQGFAVESGRATAPVSKARLTGGVGALLRGIAAVGRDLSFEMLDGMIGSPSLLVMGLELRGE